jgi:hypothetical protein
MGSLGTLGRLPLDVRRLVYGLAALYLSRTCRRIREQCKSVPICGKEMQRYVRYVTSAGLARSILVIPLTGVRGATVLDLQHDQSAHQSALEYLEGKEEVVADRTTSLLVYRRRGSGGDVRRSAVVTCERVMRRQLEVLVRGLYCTLEDLVGCRLVPGTLTVDEGRPLSEDEKVAAERRILSHFRMGDDWHRSGGRGEERYPPSRLSRRGSGCTRRTRRGSARHWRRVGRCLVRVGTWPTGVWRTFGGRTRR